MKESFGETLEKDEKCVPTLAFMPPVFSLRYQSIDQSKTKDWCIAGIERVLDDASSRRGRLEYLVMNMIARYCKVQ